MRLFLLFALLLSVIWNIPAAEKLENPYGVCAHVSRAELEIAPREFQRMHEAGIRRVRTDFDWSGVEPERGRWDFSRLDRLINAAETGRIDILPILDYDVPWATPAWKHLDSWGEYVRRTVSRYAKKLRCWEVWNEQNSLNFWRDTPNGANYVRLLKRACEEIKAIDPELTVLYGGTAGVPLDFIEDSFRAGAGKYFDVMNIHPYHWDGVPELMIAQLRNLKTLMKKYHLEKKPIWITEVGWSTAQPPAFYREVLPAAFKRAGIDPSRTTAAVVTDMKRGFSGALMFSQSQNVAMFRKVETIGFDTLRGLSVERVPVLIPSGGEDFPAEYIPCLIDYVRRGGTLLLPSGLPFYYDLRPDGKKVQVNDKFLREFHIGWEAWWMRDGVPKKESWQKPAPGFEGSFQLDFRPAGRFLHGRNLRKGDEFIPVVAAGTDTYTGAVAALYRLNSDLKGNIIVCTTLAVTETVPEERQAELLPRTWLIALANEVERVYWYCFRSKEFRADEREDHFGIVRKDLTPKPAFHACRTLSRLCPSGSSVPVLNRHGEAYVAGWTRPDGKKVWAIWSALVPCPVKLEVKGKITGTLNHLGVPQPPPGREFTARPAILYLFGPESLSITPR